MRFASHLQIVDFRKFEIPLKSPVQSLSWRGDALIDWAGGNCIYELDGGSSGRNVNWSHRFDAAVQSPSGATAVIYERLGTKGVILNQGKFVREINRSFYCSDAYEFPVALFQHADGRELIVHCPDEYNQLEIDDAISGQRLTASADRKPDDFFHSRLAVSPGQTRLLSAGWVWHPVNMVATWLIAETLANCTVLDHANSPCKSCVIDINNAAFVDEDRIVINAGVDAHLFNREENPVLVPGSLAVLNLQSQCFETVAKSEQPVGRMQWLGDDRLVGFFEHPRIFDVATGQVLFEWPDISTGKQDSSIIHHLGKLPTVALDSPRRRFAVAAEDKIIVIELE